MSPTTKYNSDRSSCNQDQKALQVYTSDGPAFYRSRLLMLLTSEEARIRGVGKGRSKKAYDSSIKEYFKVGISILTILTTSNN